MRESGRSGSNAVTGAASRAWDLPKAGPRHCADQVSRRQECAATLETRPPSLAGQHARRRERRRARYEALELERDVLVHRRRDQIRRRIVIAALPFEELH